MKKLVLVFLVTVAGAGFAQNATTRKEHFNTNAQNVVNDGYDPVSYFNGKPLKGQSLYSFGYKGVIYWFVNDNNRATFKDNPSKYEPQYGGWCAYALGLRPEKVKVDPNTYKIIDGKLYLFYNFYLTNTLKLWNKNEVSLKQNADKNWQKILVDSFN